MLLNSVRMVRPFTYRVLGTEVAKLNGSDHRLSPPGRSVNVYTVFVCEDPIVSGVPPKIKFPETTRKSDRLKSVMIKLRPQSS